MNSRLPIALTLLMIIVSAGVVADEDRLDPARPDAAGTGIAQPGAQPAPERAIRPSTSPAVPGGSYRNQAPPRYRIEQGQGGNAFPRVPGTNFRDYSRPSYNTQQ